MAREVSEGFWEVESSSTPGKKYYVDLRELNCTCRGFEFRGTCKHLRALEPERAKYVQKLREELAEVSSKW